VAAQLIVQQQHLHTVTDSHDTHSSGLGGLLLRENFLLLRLFKTTTVHLLTMEVKTRLVEVHRTRYLYYSFFLLSSCLGEKGNEALKHRRRCSRGCGPVQCVQLIHLQIACHECSFPSLLLFLFSFSYHSFRLAALFLFSLLLIYPLHLPSLCLILSYFILFCFIHFHAISVRSILTAPFPSCLRVSLHRG